MTPSSKPPSSATHWIAAAPAAFVLLWSTGFIGSKYGIPYAEPFTLTVLRMIVVVTILLVVSVVMRAPWPRTPRAVMHIAVAGLLVHATYLSGVLYAIVHELPLGFVAMIAGLQPVATAVFAHLLLGERLNARQWFGMALGVAGVVLVIASKFSMGNLHGAGLLAATLALCGITAGTLYQKRFCATMDLRTGGVIQYSATGMVLAVLAMMFDSAGSMDPTIYRRIVMAGGRAVDWRHWPAVPDDSTRCGIASGKPVFPDARGHRSNGVGLVW